MIKNVQKRWFSITVVFGICILIGQQYFLSRSFVTSRGNDDMDRVRRSSGIGTNVSTSVVIRESKKWIVVDALTSPCRDVADLTRQNGDWVLVVVTQIQVDIQNCRSPGCVQLTWEMCQRDLRYLATIHELTAPSVLCGYFLALLSDAEIIVDATCYVPISGGLDEGFRLRQDEATHGLWYNETPSFNPYEHWGLEGAFPTELGQLMNMSSGAETNSHMMYLADMAPPAIRQGVVVSPFTCQWISSTDASPGDDSPLHMKSYAAVGPDTLAPLRTGPTYFSKHALPLLFLPEVEPKELASLFRTLWIHVLKRLNLLSVAYFLLQPSGNEKCQLLEASKALKYPAARKCVERISCKIPTHQYRKCLQDTASGVMTCLEIRGQSTSLEAWLGDMENLESLKIVEKSSPQIDNIFKMTFNYNRQHNLQANRTERLLLDQRLASLFSPICPMSSPPNLWEPPVDDVMLVVVINYDSLYWTVPYMELVHRQYFKYILYCGPSADSFVRYAENASMTHVTFVAGLSHSWHFMYECVTHAMKLRLPVKGYLQIGEDVLLSSWTLAGFPKDRIWIPGGFTKTHMYKVNKAEKWFHWNSDLGQRGVINAFAELTNASVMSNQQERFRFHHKYHAFAKRFLEIYKSNLGLNHILHRATDIFYIPEVLREDYIMASELFRRHRTMIEIALPVIHLGLSRKDDVTYLSGASLWGDNRVRPWKYYNVSTSHFLHPFKLRLVTELAEGKNFMCRTYWSKYVRESNSLRQNFSRIHSLRNKNNFSKQT